MLPSSLPASLIDVVRHLKLVVFDVDGVLTNGHIILGDQGQELKTFHSEDGQGIKLLQLAGLEVAIITGRQSGSVTHRMQELQVPHVYQGAKDKLHCLNLLLDKLALSATQASYLGDDLPDLACIQSVGFGVAVNNAIELLKQQAHWQTHRKGGEGAARELCDLILTVQGKWPAVLNHFKSAS